MTAETYYKFKDYNADLCRSMPVCTTKSITFRIQLER